METQVETQDSIPALRLTDYGDPGSSDSTGSAGSASSTGAKRAFASGLRRALEEFGFVRIVDHAVPSDLVDEVYRACARFFALSDSDKRRCGGAPGGARGFTAFGVEHARDRSTPDLKEFFHVGREVAPSDPPAPLALLANRWPEAVPSLARCAPRLFGALEECSRTLLAALATAYELPESALADMLVGGNHVLRALHYPPVSRDVAAGALRAAPHEDINLITLLCEATEPGLEILRPDGQWMAVRAGKGEIVVDAGDMLARVTNGVIPATTHRVVNPTDPSGPTDRHRYSLPFFAHPRPECDLSVLDAFQGPERPPRTPPITAGAFLEERLREIGLS